MVVKNCLEKFIMKHKDCSYYKTCIQRDSYNISYTLYDDSE